MNDLNVRHLTGWFGLAGFFLFVSHTNPHTVVE